MATVTAYADIVEQVLDVYTKIPYAHGDLTCEAIFDRPRSRFVLMTLGWDDDERVHHPLAHVDIIGGKLWIQTDGARHRSGTRARRRPEIGHCPGVSAPRGAQAHRLCGRVME